ncbi:MAG TPA: hypothetical protein VMM57_00695 [Bacteroidota bacterium]|nr:hypothetical protein [Bacteroidota bacterium]
MRRRFHERLKDALPSDRRAARFLHIGLASLVLAATGCELFKTRDPEPPEQVSSTFIPPTIDSLVFTNMIEAFNDLNSDNYLECLADSTTSPEPFAFEPTPSARQQYASVFSAWTLQSERQYFDRMKSSLQAGTTMSLTFTSLQRQTIASDSATYEATYTLTVPHTFATIPKQAQGRAQFFLGIDRTGYWVIRRWVDLSINQGDVTWSDLKGAFGQ